MKGPKMQRDNTIDIDISEVQTLQRRIRFECCCRRVPDLADITRLDELGSLTDELAEMITFAKEN